MINRDFVRIGSDFEYFLKEKKTGKIRSAIPFNSGTKLTPELLDRDGCCIQRDGVLQECNVPPVRLGEAEEFWANVQYVVEFVNNKLEGEGLEIECCASATLDKKEMKDKEAHILGCDADYNAWEGGIANPKPTPTNKYFRTCGAHFHMSYEEHNTATALELVKLFDLFTVVPYILIDEDTDRRKLYGKAGSFRMQQWGDVYGVEFRQLSNKCLESFDLLAFVFNQFEVILDWYNNHEIGSIDKSKKDIVNCINNSDRKLARKLCKKYNILLPIEYISDGDLLETV